MSELIMMVGLPGCGKSTWIKNFKEAHPEFFEGDDPAYVVISLDDVIMEMGAEEGLSYSEAWERFTGAASKVMKERARNAFAATKSILWDQTNLTVKVRRKALTPALNAGYNCKAVVFSLLDSELKKRTDQRKVETGKEVASWIVNNMARSYEAPSKEEGFSIISYIRK